MSQVSSCRIQVRVAPRRLFGTVCGRSIKHKDRNQGPRFDSWVLNADFDKPRPLSNQLEYPQNNFKVRKLLLVLLWKINLSNRCCTSWFFSQILWRNCIDNEARDQLSFWIWVKKVTFFIRRWKKMIYGDTNNVLDIFRWEKFKVAELPAGHRWNM